MAFVALNHARWTTGQMIDATGAPGSSRAFVVQMSLHPDIRLSQRSMRPHLKNDGMQRTKIEPD
jgi:hypothetical protein